MEVSDDPRTKAPTRSFQDNGEMASDQRRTTDGEDFSLQ
jgi:hypothetical protein